MSEKKVHIRYEKAPLVEAIIDIRIEYPNAVTQTELKSFSESVAGRYPKELKRMQGVGEFQMGERVGATATQDFLGFQLWSADRTQVVRGEKDGFSFSRLRPYWKWEQLRDEARSLWTEYRKYVSGPHVSRVAVRYINQIDIPAREIDYKDYFRTIPEVGPDLPQGLSGFLMQLQFPLADFGGGLVLTQTEARPPDSNTTSIILDLDVFKQDANGIDDEEIWPLLEKMRDCKNKFFEGSITSRTRELFGVREEKYA